MGQELEEGDLEVRRRIEDLGRCVADDGRAA